MSTKPIRILIVFHGRLPEDRYPSTGIGVRACTNGLGLEAHGYEVCYASRRRDLIAPSAPGTPPIHPFEGKAELQTLIKRLAPGLILLEGTYEMSSVQDLEIPIALDLFAPRTLEAQWQDLDISQEMMSLLNAMARADYYLVTTDRQRHFYVGAMTLAGVDCREDRIATVPLAILPDNPPRSLNPDPILVSGGVAWPWQDPRWALELIVHRMRQTGRGELHLLRGPYPLGVEPGDVAPLPVDAQPPVHVHPLLPFAEMTALLSAARAVVDLTAPNLEREMALSFRQLDALRCGVPLLVCDHMPLAQLIRSHRAGWVIKHGDETGLQAALDEILDQPEAVEERGLRARQLGEELYSPSVALESLTGMIRLPSRRKGRETLASAAARQVAEAESQKSKMVSLARDMEALKADLKKKDREIKDLGAQNKESRNTIGRLSTSLESALYLQQQSAQIFSEKQDEALTDLVAEQRAQENCRREIAKKERELERLALQRDQLEDDLKTVRDRNARLEQSWEKSNREANILRGQIQTLEAQLGLHHAELIEARSDLDKKRIEVEGLWETRDQLNQDISRLVARSRSADSERAAREALFKDELIALDKELQSLKEENLRLSGLGAELNRLNALIQQKEAALQARSLAGVIHTVRNTVETAWTEIKKRE